METHIGHSSIGVFLIRLPENRDRSYPRNVCIFDFILNTYDGPSPNYLLLKKALLHGVVRVLVCWCVVHLFRSCLFQAARAYLRFLKRKETYKYLTSCVGSSPCVFSYSCWGTLGLVFVFPVSCRLATLILTDNLSILSNSRRYVTDCSHLDGQK
jgi:hypothetical protein